MSESVPSDGPRLRSEFPVFRTISTRWDDEDVYGHVNNVVYYSYFDTAVNGYLMEATGTDIRQLEAIGLVVESQCTFKASLSFPAEVKVGLAVRKLGGTSITYRIGLFQGESDEPAGIGTFVHVYVDAATRKVTRIPQVIKDAVAPLTQ